MRVTLINKNKLKNLVLPNKIEGSYWLTDIDTNGIEKNLVSIVARDNNWVLISNNEIKYEVDKIFYPEVILKEYQFYSLSSLSDKKKYLLYCSPNVETYNYYDITNELKNGITIGNTGLITYGLINTVAAQIKVENNEIYIYDNQFDYGIYVNDIRVKQRMKIELGDVIYIVGMKIILTMKDHNYYAAVNNPCGKVKVQLLSVSDISTQNDFKEETEEFALELYDDNDYFHKMPRFVSVINPLELSVDPPPSKVEDPNNSLLLTIGPMLTMSMTSLVTGYTAVNSVLDGSSTWSRAMPSLVICVAMFSSVLIWPSISKRIEKKRIKEQERKRQQKYGQYIEEKRHKIQESINEQKNILNNNYPSVKECEEIILNKYTSLWQKRIEDGDFLDVSLGYGNCPMKINIKYPEDHFSMAEDNLKEMVSQLGNEPKILSNVPIVYSLYDNFISSVVGEEDLTSEYIKRLIIQLVAYHSYKDLKIVIFTDEEKEYHWDFLKKMPHCFSDDKSLRFFATKNDEYKEVFYYLDRTFKERLEYSKNDDIEKENLKQVYLIITDSFKKIRNFDAISSILEHKYNYGFSMLISAEKVIHLPDQCKSFIQLKKDGGELHNNITNNEIIKFKFDNLNPVNYKKCAQVLFNIPIKMANNDEAQLPEKLGFLEMYDVGKVEQLNSIARWRSNNPTQNLQAPVGIGKNGEKITIDLHEKYHGPHGLIAGMTGSGKSEFIISYILSMAINYHPYEVQFILIDYKGGGLSGAFENKSTGLKLPHLVGTITNLDTNEIKRSLSSIESELKRRQALFNEAREVSHESTVDIYKYQKMFRDGVVKEPVSHLFIISDEFAELKNQQPEFMEQLISTARIGRSLGVHLILATQKPSGVVDPQIWSNTRFRISLRVQDKSDSDEIIKCPDAAYLKQTGRFYFQVGYNEIFTLGQAAWAGGKYYPAEKVNKNIDTAINFIDNIGYAYRTVETRQKVEREVSQGEELLNIVKYLNQLALSQNVHCRPLWLEKIPAVIFTGDLKIKYNYQKVPNIINPIIGEYDIPTKQIQQLLTLNFAEDGNTLVYGSSGSGKENFITTMIYSSMCEYTPNEVNYYIIDFGSETLKMFKDSAIVGDILNTEDEEKIKNLFKMLHTTIDERKQLLADYNGDYYTYCSKTENPVPTIIVIINNYESYQETYPEFDDDLIVLSRECSRYGIYFVMTLNTPNGARFKLRQNFTSIFVLQQNSEDDYTAILGNVSKNYPSKIFGRGIIKKDAVYEFQTAYVCEPDNINEFIKEQCLKYLPQTKAQKIPVLPEIVSYQHLVDTFGTSNEIIIGLDKATLSLETFDFHKGFVSTIMALDMLSCMEFTNNLIKQIILRKDSSLLVVNTDEYVVDTSEANLYQYVDSQFDDVFDSLNNFVTEQKAVYEQNNFDKKIFEGKKPICCVIIGIESFKNRLNEENKNKFNDLFNNAKDLGIIDFILVDSIDKFKKMEMDSWYKNCVNSSNGIWIGNGINDQYTLKVTQKVDEMKEEIEDRYCFVVERGKAKFVKYIQEIDL